MGRSGTRLTSTNRAESFQMCDIHLVIFLAKKYKTEYCTLWRTKKSHFRPSDEVSMRTVDKDAVNTKIGPICFLEALSSISGVGACAVRMRFRALLRVWITWRGSPPRAARLAGSCRTASPVVVLKGRLTSPHVGNNNCATYRGRIGWVLNDVQGMLTSTFSSLMGLPNPAWVSRAIVVSHMGGLKGLACRSC
jgi:hypothetical protein